MIDFDNHEDVMQALATAQEIELDRRAKMNDCVSFVTDPDGQWEPRIAARFDEYGRPKEWIRTGQVPTLSIKTFLFVTSLIQSIVFGSLETTRKGHAKMLLVLLLSTSSLLMSTKNDSTKMG
jgi:hypothetical protein